MASFTVTLAEVMEDRGVETVEGSLSLVSVIGLADYPIFQESYRDILNRKIIMRYWNREVGHETLEMFRFRMWARMNEIMPYYNQLFESTMIKFDPISTMDITTVANDATRHGDTTTSTGTTKLDTETANTTEGTNNSNNTASNGSRTVNSLTPQNQLSDNGDYADSMADVNSAGQNTSNTTETGEGLLTTDTTESSDATQTRAGDQDTQRNSNTKGYQGLPADLLRRYRETLINVDMMILDNLATLFMSVTSTGDEYFYSHNPYPFSGLGHYAY